MLLDGVEIAASGAEEVSGQGAIILPFPTVAASGAERVQGTGAIILPFPDLSGQGESELLVSAIVLSPVVLSALGTVTSDVIVSPPEAGRIVRLDAEIRSVRLDAEIRSVRLANEDRIEEAA